MGLLEKALQYKEEMNSRGKETLIDRIAGPADTEALPEFERVPEKEETSALMEEQFESGNSFLLDSEEESAAKDEEYIISSSSDISESHDLDISSEEGEPAEEPYDFSENEEQWDIEDFIPEQATEPEVQRDLSEDSDIDLELHDFPEIPEEKNRFDEKRIPDIDEKGLSENDQPDYMALYELGKEILSVKGVQELYDVLLFSLIGQLGASSASVMVQDRRDPQNWFVAESRGVLIDQRELEFSTEKGILFDAISRNEVTDIEKYRDNKFFQEEYYRFIGIDGRILVPVIYEKQALACVLLGDKLDSSEYTSKEFEFLKGMGETAGIKLSQFLKQNELEEKIKILETEQKQVERNRDVTAVFSASKDIDDLVSNLRDILKGEGLVSYAIYIKDNAKDVYRLRLNETEDFLSLRKEKSVINVSDPFIRALQTGSMQLEIADPARSDYITETFGAETAQRMSGVKLYPSFIAGILEGFLAVFSAMDTVSGDSLFQMAIDIIATGFDNFIEQDKQFNKYRDDIEQIYSRMESSLARSVEMNIPFSIVLFSIKNYRRFYSLYGYAETQRLFERLEKIIRSRLDEPDYAFRYSRQEIVAVLPGKSKKFAVTMANSVRNEIIESFRSREMQLLVPFFVAEYPSDGEDLNTLIDSID